MKVNYQLEYEKIINSLSYKPSLLLHSCCAPCSSSVLETLSDYFDITVYYYNPNIEPIDEYIHRKDEQKRLLDILGIKFMDSDYDNDEYRSLTESLASEPEGGARCGVCFKMRLLNTAKKAKDNGFEYFGTTLTISPHKDSQLINKIGLSIESSLGIKYLTADFKKKNGYIKSIENSKKYDLYRQDYCGCLYAKNNQ